MSGLECSEGRALFGRGGIVVGEELELEAVGGADGGQLAGVGGVAVFGGLTVNARSDEAARALEVADQIDGLIVGAEDAQLDIDVAVLGALRLDGRDLNAGGRTVSMASMARVQEKAFSSKRSLRNSACLRSWAFSGRCMKAWAFWRSAWMRAIWPSSECSRSRAWAAWLSKRCRPSRKSSESAARMAMPMRRRLRAGPRSVKGRVARLSAMRIGLAHSRQGALRRRQNWFEAGK